MTRLRVLLAGTALAFAIVPFAAPPAHACFSTQCIVNCVVDLATVGYCRL